MNNKNYHSKYGGLWIDHIYWENELLRKVGCGKLSDIEASQIVDFVNNGFIVLEGACSSEEVDNFADEITRAFSLGHDELLFQLPGDPTRRHIEPGMPTRNIRIVDSYVHLESAKNLLANAHLERFLQTIFECDPLLFQSLSFNMGSEQGFHQDTAYVVVDNPLELAAAWIALEDIQVGSGELSYIVGSHRLPDYNFGGDKKHWNPDIDGHKSHDEWGGWIAKEANTLGLKENTFIAKKGDILVWHADLVHGGSKIIDPSLSRRSLVGHYCTISSNPNYFSYLPSHAVKSKFANTYFSSEHYKING